MTQAELEKQILETIERVRGFKMNYPSELITKEQASKEIASLMEQYRNEGLRKLLTEFSHYWNKKEEGLITYTDISKYLKQKP